MSAHRPERQDHPGHLVAVSFCFQLLAGPRQLYSAMRHIQQNQVATQ